MNVNRVTGQIVDAAIKVHTVLGPGLLERAYQVCLAHALVKRELAVRSEVLMPVRYDGLELGVDYRIDLLVEECVIVEVKAVAMILSVHQAQLLSQLRFADRRVGLLINFNVPRLKDGIVRLVNRL